MSQLIDYTKDKDSPLFNIYNKGRQQVRVFPLVASSVNDLFSEVTVKEAEDGNRTSGIDILILGAFKKELYLSKCVPLPSTKPSNSSHPDLSSVTLRCSRSIPLPVTPALCQRMSTLSNSSGVTEVPILTMAGYLSILLNSGSTIPPSMTGGNSTPSVMRKRNRCPVDTWGPYTKLRDGVGFKWYTHMRDCTSVESAKGNHECLVTMHAQIDESEPSICWFLRFQLLEKGPGDAGTCTRPKEQISQLCLRVKANDEEFGWVNVELNYRPDVPRLDTIVHCDGIPNLWQISRKAAGNGSMDDKDIKASLAVSCNWIWLMTKQNTSQTRYIV